MPDDVPDIVEPSGGYSSWLQQAQPSLLGPQDKRRIQDFFEFRSVSQPPFVGLESGVLCQLAVAQDADTELLPVFVSLNGYRDVLVVLGEVQARGGNHRMLGSVPPRNLPPIPVIHGGGHQKRDGAIEHRHLDLATLPRFVSLTQGKR